MFDRFPVRRWAKAVCVVLTIGCPTAGPAAALDAGPLAATPPDRIVAFGDVHGALTELESLLGALGLIDAQRDWRGGRTRLVSLGDLLDRGPDSRAVMDLLMKLESQAASAGGALHVVLGNHEIMNLTGDLRYVSRAEYAAFAADEDPATRARARKEYLERAASVASDAVAREADTGVGAAPDQLVDPAVAFDRDFPPGYFAHRAAFAPDGVYGSWLLGKPQVLVLDGTAFVHGGLSEVFAGLGIDEFNARSANELRRLLALGAELLAADRLEPWQDLLHADPAATGAPPPDELVRLRESLQFASNGPTWYRGTAACHPILEQPRFAAMLAGRGLIRVVMGHTTTFPRMIQTRFDGRAVLADTGMYADYYRGRPSAAVFGGETPRYLSLAGSGEMIELSGSSPIDIRAGGSQTLLDRLGKDLAGAVPPDRGKPLPVEADGRRQLAWYRPGTRRQNGQQLAAQALDRLLGIGLVAPVIQPSGADRGVFEVMPAASFSETERVASGRYRPNWCAEGSDYDFVYILDALLGIDARSGEMLHYDPATWLIYLTGNQDAFPTWQRLPNYLASQSVNVPPVLAERLANLSADALEGSLGAYLSDRQQRAVLARRDLILESWSNGAVTQ